LPTYDGGIAFELVTPTGAAIVGAHAEGAARWPAMTPERVGWGAGTASLADRPNLLRVVLGDSAAAVSVGTHVVVEANVDDATGELLGHCIEALLAAGALDAWAVPLTMKKGRPAFQLGAIAPASLGDAIAAVMLRESTTIGVRRHEVSRVERPRRIEHVSTPYGRLPVKISEGPFGPPARKPEFDACLAAAAAHGVPVRVVLEAVLAANPSNVSVLHEPHEARALGAGDAKASRTIPHAAPISSPAVSRKSTAELGKKASKDRKDRAKRKEKRSR
jgi:uncharacterized protein (DUF111 family)